MIYALAVDAVVKKKLPIFVPRQNAFLREGPFRFTGLGAICKYTHTRFFLVVATCGGVRR